MEKEAQAMNIADQPSLEGIERFYCLAMLAQYSPDFKPKQVGEPEDHAWNFRWQMGHYEFLHEWKSTPDASYRAGVVSIYWGQIKIWEMQYEDTCPRNLRPGLRTARTNLYSQETFAGPDGHFEDVRPALIYGYIYRKVLRLHVCRIKRFLAEETISSTSGDLYGTIRMTGGLVPSHFNHESRSILEDTVCPLPRAANE